MWIYALVALCGFCVGAIAYAEFDHWVRCRALDKEIERWDSESRLMTRGGVTIGRRLNNLVILEKARKRPRSEIARLFEGTND